MNKTLVSTRSTDTLPSAHSVLRKDHVHQIDPLADTYQIYRYPPIGPQCS
jgi:hypothetical protein